MPTYTFRLPGQFSSSPVSVYNTSDVLQTSGTTDANATFSVSLPTGDYYARVSYGYRSYTAAGEVSRGDLDNISEAGLSATFVGGPTPTPPASPQVGQTWLSSAYRHLRAPSSLARRASVIAKTQTWESSAIQEVWTFTDATKIHCLYNAGGIGYAYCLLTSDPTKASSWVKPGSAAVIATLKHGVGFLEGSTVHYYGIDTATSTKVMHTQASTSDLTTWTTPAQVLALPAGSNVFGNPSVVKDGTTYRMLIEHKVAATGRWQTGQATATAADGTFTFVSGVEVMTSIQPDAIDRTSSGGPCVFYDDIGDGNPWTLWYHASVNWNGLLPSDIFRAVAPSLGADNFTILDNKEPVIRRRGLHEVDQVADIHLQRLPDGRVLGFWTGMHNRGGSFTGSVTVAEMLPELMRWDGARWVVADHPAEQNRAITDMGKPRTAYVTTDNSIADAGAGVWQDIAGLSMTFSPSGPDYDIELMGVMAPTGSSGFKYQFRAVVGGTPTGVIGMVQGTVGIATQVSGAIKMTQQTPQKFVGVKVQVQVPAGGGTIHCRPVGQGGNEYARLRCSDSAYP